MPLRRGIRDTDTVTSFSVANPCRGSSAVVSPDALNLPEYAHRKPITGCSNYSQFVQATTALELYRVVQQSGQGGRLLNGGGTPVYDV